MLKFVAQVVVAGAVIAGGGALDLSGWAVAGLVLAGFVVGHLLWEALAGNPFDYMGAMPIDDDDPLMNAARAEAKNSMSRFFELFESHQENSMVKFRFRTSAGRDEYLWGDAIDIDLTKGRATVFVRTPPAEHDGDFERKRHVGLADLCDWQIELEDGRLLGGFTNKVMFKIYEREHGHMHPKFDPHWQRFTDLSEFEGHSAASGST